VHYGTTGWSPCAGADGLLSAIKFSEIAEQKNRFAHCTTLNHNDASLTVASNAAD